MKKGWFVLSTALLSLSLVGCGANNNNASDNNQNQARQTEQARISNVNNNNKLSVSDRAEKQVEKLAEVDDARVIIANNDAYVSIKLNNNDTGNQENNGQNGQKNNGNNNGNNNRNGNVFSENGTVDQDRNNADSDNGIIDGRGDAGKVENGKNNNQNNKNNNNIMGTENGNGKTDNDNDKRITHYSSVSTRFEQKIADQVRQADDKIHRVYVSFNPDLYTKMNTYADDIQNNRNQNNLFDDFTNTVEDFFRR